MSRYKGFEDFDVAAHQARVKGAQRPYAGTSALAPTQDTLPGIPSENVEEFEEQCRLVQWCRDSNVFVVASLNGAMLFGTKAQRAAQWSALVKAGARKGWLDLMVIAPDGRHLHIELKRIKGGRLTPEQADTIALLNSMNVPAIKCEGAEQAKDAIRRHLKGERLGE